MADFSNIDRREFHRRVLAGVAGAALPPVAAATETAGRTAPPLKSGRLPIKPPRLKEGDLVGLVTPSGHIDDDKIAKCVENLQTLGLKVRLGNNIRALRGNFAGTAQQRLDDLHGMFADPQVKAVWAATGGSGAIGLLSSVDYKLIRRNPKIFVGYSDITALHLAIARQTGLVTFHGPVASSTFTDYSVAHLRAVLMAPQPQYVIQMAAENLQPAPDAPQFALRTLRGGSAEGRLTGGNLSLLCALVGTPYAADFGDGIVFMEEIGEAPYRIDRMLTQLELSQGFRRAAGVMLGVFQKCGPPDSDPSLTLDETIDDHVAALPGPAVYGYSFGHVRSQFTLPVGLMARLDTGKQTLTLLEPAVE